MIDIPAEYVAAVRRALEEDDAVNDITTLSVVPEETRGRARLIANERCVIAGLEAVHAAFTLLDPNLTVTLLVADGDPVDKGEVVATIEGRLRPILSAERVALNFIQRLSGIATLTRLYVESAGDAQILDTRKTTPGLRLIEKDAVYHGGGAQHRLSLSDGILIKDNHIAAAGSITAAVKAAQALNRLVEVECDTLDQVREALAAGADEILLDNMDIPTLKAAVAVVGGQIPTEASGGITLVDIPEVAATGVDSISVGALTHSAPSIDFSLEIEAV